MRQNNTKTTISVSCIVPAEYAGKRLDLVAALLFPDYSRSLLQEWIKLGFVTLNGRVFNKKDRVACGDEIKINAFIEPKKEWQAQQLDGLNIVYEDDDIIVLDKPAGLIVHPGAGNPDKTLLNALLYHVPDLNKVPRAGIIHRIDKDTSGLMIVAKNLVSHTKLIKAMQDRAICREYEAVVIGAMISGGFVDAPIARSPHKRTAMAVVYGGKPAVTHYSILRRFSAYTHLGLKLETGRTHQIRVHMAHIGYPLVGDRTYGGRMKTAKGMSKELMDVLRNFKRQALHARRLTFKHPGTCEKMCFESNLPKDMRDLLIFLEAFF